MDQEQNNQEDQSEDKSFLRVIVHSFFIIQFLIAVFCVVLFAGIRLLTQEKRSVYEYLEDVKTGGASKRWQGAFELSKILSNPEMTPQEERFTNEMINAFQKASHDDSRVRQYLALAMGRTENKAFGEVLIQGLKDEKEENIPALLYAIGMLKDPKNASHLYGYVSHNNPRIRSIAVVSLGNLADPASKSILKKGLQDSEPNVQWGAAISLAKMGDSSGKEILLKLLDRKYLSQFSEVDQDEENNLIISAIEVSAAFADADIKKKFEVLSTKDQNMKVRAAALKQLKNY